MKSCLLCKFEFVQCSAWFFDQATGLVFLLLSNQRLLECFYGIYRDRHFICSGDMCSLPSHPCHSSCTCSCCEVLLLCKFEFVQFSAWFFDQATGLVFLLLSNQKLLECFYGIYTERHFICSGDMCSLPSHPCHNSWISSCCDVLLHCLILGLYHAVHGLLTKLEVWYYIVFPSRGCWKVFFMVL